MWREGDGWREREARGEMMGGRRGKLYFTPPLSAVFFHSSHVFKDLSVKKKKKCTQQH